MAVNKLTVSPVNSESTFTCLREYTGQSSESVIEGSLAQRTDASDTAICSDSGKEVSVRSLPRTSWVRDKLGQKQVWSENKLG